MAIETTQQVYANGTYSLGETTYSSVGRVLDIRTYVARRNVSDTLDYTDFQDVHCTDALVYRGRVHRGPDWWSSRAGTYVKDGDQVPVAARFEWVDCSNHFAWRGSDVRHAKVDARPEDDAEMAEDFAQWVAGEAALAMVVWSRRCQARWEEQARKAQEERDRPVVGKQMTVKGGRKVPVGTQGTVAHISRDSGKVLLKDDARWQDRKADGVWVDPRHLKAR